MVRRFSGTVNGAGGRIMQSRLRICPVTAGDAREESRIAAPPAYPAGMAQAAALISRDSCAAARSASRALRKTWPSMRLNLGEAAKKR